MKINKSKEDLQPAVLKIIQEGGSPTEQLVDFGWATIQPSGWYYFLTGILTTFLTKYVILALTNERLIIINTDMLLTPKNYITFPLSQLRCLKFNTGFTYITLSLLFPDNKKEKYQFFKNDKSGWNTVAEKIAGVLPKV